MKHKLITFLLLVSLLGLMGCDPHQRRHRRNRQHTEHVHRWSVKQSDDTMIYWYLLTMDSEGTKNYYYYSSPTFYSTYSSITWQSAGAKIPAELENLEQQENVSDMGEQPVAEADLGTEMQAEIDQSVADMVSEGNPNDADMSTDGNDSSSDSSSDSGSSDSGGGDSGGDGGGGGE